MALPSLGELGGSGVFTGIGGAVADIFGAKGYKAEAASYVKARDFSKQSGNLVQAATAIKETQQQRELYKVVGSQQAGYAASGVAMAGSALDILRSSMAEGELDRQLIRTQGLVDKNAFDAEAAAYQGQADAAKQAGKAKKASGVGQLITAGLSLAAMFSDRRLKEDIVFVRHHPRLGLNVYHFRYIGEDVVWEGFMADEVEDKYPEAIDYHGEENYMSVDYSKLGFTPRQIKAAA
jgi:hypothetical protein